MLCAAKRKSCYYVPESKRVAVDAQLEVIRSARTSADLARLFIEQECSTLQLHPEALYWLARRARTDVWLLVWINENFDLLTAAAPLEGKFELLCTVAAHRDVSMVYNILRDINWDILQSRVWLALLDVGADVTTEDTIVEEIVRHFIDLSRNAQVPYHHQHALQVANKLSSRGFARSYALWHKAYGADAGLLCSTGMRVNDMPDGAKPDQCQCHLTPFGHISPGSPVVGLCRLLELGLAATAPLAQRIVHAYGPDTLRLVLDIHADKFNCASLVPITTDVNLIVALITRHGVPSTTRMKGGRHPLTAFDYVVSRGDVHAVSQLVAHGAEATADTFIIAARTRNPSLIKTVLGAIKDESNERPKAMNRAYHDALMDSDHSLLFVLAEFGYSYTGAADIDLLEVAFERKDNDLLRTVLSLSQNVVLSPAGLALACLHPVDGIACLAVKRLMLVDGGKERLQRMLPLLGDAARAEMNP